LDTVENTPRIVRVHGFVGMKQTQSTKFVTTGKNIGKINETTPYEQAESIVKSYISKQYANGFADCIKDIKKQILPMLAHCFNKRGKDIEDSCFVQPKLDGVRCIADNQGNLFTRTGKNFYHLEHIKAAIRLLNIPHGVYLDGELYVNGVTFEKLCSITKQTKTKSNEERIMEFHIFDKFDLEDLDEPFITRLKYIESLNLTGTLRIVESKRIEKKSIKTYHDKYFEQGYEGVIVRNENSRYTLKERSKDLQKYKEFQDGEYVIVDGKEADGEDKGTVIFVCETKTKARFSVRPRGTRELRKKYFTNLHEYIGKQLTVRYQNLSENMVPRFPVGISIRDYE